MCIKLYNSYKSDITNFKKIYNDNFDSESNEADEIVILIKSINNKSCSDNIEVINYLTCKTVLNDKFDYYNYLVKYTILEESNKFTIENNYIEIIKYWKLNDDFMIFVKQNLISKK
jgi:hypothetical protein